jgi:hypothetical protein
MQHGRGAGCLEEIGNGSMPHSLKSRVILSPEMSFHCAAHTKDRFGDWRIIFTVHREVRPPAVDIDDILRRTSTTY